MTNYVITAAKATIIIQTDFSSIGRPGTLLKHRTADEVAIELARFNRWAENERGRFYRDYKY